MSQTASVQRERAIEPTRTMRPRVIDDKFDAPSSSQPRPSGPHSRLSQASQAAELEDLEAFIDLKALKA